MKPYDHKKIEKKWQKAWQSKKIYATKEDTKKEKFYILDMFPYPSGEGLHVGHPKGYIATDVVSRYKRMNNFNVLHPMGWDAFGLPAENYAIKNKIHPEIAVKKNIKRYKDQLSMIGLDYDWKREINTTDPAYYKWTQWIFLQLFKKGLAFESFEPINWCPSCKTGLANEDVEDGKCDRCGSVVEKKPLRQWVLKITDYAERLLNDLDALDENNIPHVIDPKNPPQKGKKSVARKMVHALVRDPKTGKMLAIKWKTHPWTSFVTGGLDGEDLIVAARREVTEETGYKNLKFIQILGGVVKGEYYAAHKGENRVAYSQAVLFELENHDQVAISAEESKEHDVVWVDPKTLSHENFTCAELDIWLERLEKYTPASDSKLLQWPESIKELQKNWIGRSEGAQFEFLIIGSNEKITVFTTRPDTLFGVTYVVLAPESKLIDSLLHTVKNKDAVIKYVANARIMTEIERTDAKKDKTGVELKGVFATNPATGEKVPVWIADYVLGNYGTGAVMAVPAHDERDYAFAKKYKLPIKNVIEPVFYQLTEPGKIIQGQPFDERAAIMAIVKHWKEDKYMALKWKKVAWGTFITGGIEAGQTAEEAAKAEIREETGYLNPKLVAHYGTIHGKFYHVPKKTNRFAHAQTMLFQLKDDARELVTETEMENHEILWLTKAELAKFITPATHLRSLDILNGIEFYTGEGLLTGSGHFNGQSTEQSRIAITEKFGTKKVTYKLKDWVFARQRYWGEPIPLIHCETCGVVAVPEKDLPVKLPKVKYYLPSGTGESPLATIDKWVNVKCPQCKGKGKRETNTMPQWAGSSWYHLRFMDPKNKKALVDPKKEKYWAPVDLYVGGAEHATRHLIYARFWHKFLYDIGVVSTIEPFKNLKNQGLILAEGGEKMSKSKGNVVSPDLIVGNYGTDTFRMYEMFMGPFDQAVAWSTDSIVGVRRFIERLWKLQEKVAKNALIEKSFETLLHQTIEKVSGDIEGMRFNTAISALMILLNDAEKQESVSRETYQLFLQLVAPFAPHVADELWTIVGNKKSIHISPWPKADATKLVSDTITLVVQINSKVRAQLQVARGITENKAKDIALLDKAIATQLAGKEIKRVIFVPNKLINFVV